jgi:peroxiredoxin
MTQLTQPVQPGHAAPDFLVPAVQDNRTITLADYRGRTPLLLGLFPGLYCPFCRRALAQMSNASERLKSLGVDCLAIVGTELDNARLYFRFRPARMTLGSDPQLTTHRSYGVPLYPATPELFAVLENTYINPTGELPAPLPVPAVAARLAALDGYQPTPIDDREEKASLGQMKGQFLIDLDGVVRWASVECAEGMSGLGKFPSPDELVGAATTAFGSSARL